jgi:hypothetical protein
VPVSSFLLFLCFRKVTQEIFSELDKTKAKHPDIKRSFQRTKKETEQSQEAASPPGGAAQGLAAPPYGEGHLVHFWWCPFAYKDPPMEKPKHPITFPETHRGPPPSLTRDREGPEALFGTLPKREIAIEGLLHCHACLRHDEWVVYLGLWVHSST